MPGHRKRPLIEINPETGKPLPFILPDAPFPEPRNPLSNTPSLATSTLEISVQEVFQWGCLWLTQDEMSRVARCSRSTIANLMRDETYRAAYDEGQEQSRISLKRKQFAMAMAGDSQMLIHLGKTVLGQKETIQYEDVTRKESRQRAMEHLEKLTAESVDKLAHILTVDEEGQIIDG